MASASSKRMDCMEEGLDRIGSNYKDVLIKSTSIRASRTRVAFVMILSLKSSENTAFGGVGVVKRPSGGIKERAGCLIPHYAGPPHYLLRHSLPAHSSLPLIFADLIRALSI